MRCPKPKVRGSINQLLPTGPLGTGDLRMGRVHTQGFRLAQDCWFCGIKLTGLCTHILASDHVICLNTPVMSRYMSEYYTCNTMTTADTLFR